MTHNISLKPLPLACLMVLVQQASTESNVLSNTRNQCTLVVYEQDSIQSTPPFNQLICNPLSGSLVDSKALGYAVGSAESAQAASGDLSEPEL